MYNEHYSIDKENYLIIPTDLENVLTECLLSGGIYGLEYVIDYINKARIYSVPRIGGDTAFKDIQTIALCSAFFDSSIHNDKLYEEYYNILIDNHYLLRNYSEFDDKQPEIYSTLKNSGFYQYLIRPENKDKLDNLAQIEYDDISQNCITAILGAKSDEENIENNTCRYRMRNKYCCNSAIYIIDMIMYNLFLDGREQEQTELISQLFDTIIDTNKRPICLYDTQYAMEVIEAVYKFKDVLIPNRQLSIKMKVFYENIYNKYSNASNFCLDFSKDEIKNFVQNEYPRSVDLYEQQQGLLQNQQQELRSQQQLERDITAQLLHGKSIIQSATIDLSIF